MGNGLAYAVLAFWPLLAIYLYKSRSIQVATMWTILGGFMFLPVRSAVDLPFIPELGKNSISVISAMIGCWFVAKRPIRYFGNQGWLKLLVALIFIVPFVTVLMNRTPIVIGDLFLPGLTMHDALSVMVNQILFITPFFIGRQFFRTYHDQLLMFRTLVVAGLFYSLL